MRSLAINLIDRFDTSIQSQIKCMRVDSLSEVVYLATKDKVFSFSLHSRQIKNSVEVSGCEIISIEYLLDDECVSIITSQGDIFEWKDDNDMFECVGTMESGITCVKWSPDQEVFALTTGDEKLVLMSRELDPYFETELNPQEFGEAELITVGWGKKETQFHGTEGKPKAADLKPEIADAVLPWDDKKVRICWCDDGQYFAVSSVDPFTGARKIRVRSRDGGLYSTSEVVSGLEHPIYWRPTGNLIASSQRKPNKHDIILFEKNGLRHGEFTLPFTPKEVKVVELSWNKSSDILAVWLEELKTDEEDFLPKPLSIIQLWTRNNYHWYLKQEYKFHSMGLNVTEMIWDSELPLKLHLICNDCSLYQITLKWTVLQSNDSCVSVIDGSTLLITPFATAVVPPPMSLLKKDFESAINQVCFRNGSTLPIVALSDGTFHSLNITSSVNESRVESEAVKISRDGKMAETLDFSCFGFMHLTSWVDNCYLAVCKTKTNEDAICFIKEREQLVYDIRTVVPMSRNVLAMTADTNCVAIELTNGSVFTCDKDDDSILIKPWHTPFGIALQFPYPCQWIAVTKINHEDVVIGLTDHYRLYINDKQIADDCTSFAIHDDYLVFTSHSHRLRCLLLESLVKFANSDSKESIQEEIFTRNLERGSKIVSAVCKDTKVVLQMPRGNLETIHPRALVISYLKRLLQKCHYNEAMTVMKRHRINLNLIHDHNPELFIANIATFIENVDSENDINLFLAELQSDDVTCTYYQSCYAKTSDKQLQSDPLKVDKICSSVRSAIQSAGTKSLFLSLLTSYAKQSKPDLETVLKLIKSLKGGEIEANVSYEKALKHVLYLTDVNELYDVALGLYDFELVLMIAAKSNKDPKEYLPFLNELKSYEINYSKFKIDCHLKRYEKALAHIYNCGEKHFADCLEFIQLHGLYKVALDLSQNEKDHYKKISFLYGSYLMDNKFYNEAGIIFSRVACHEEAKNSFLKCNNWKLAMIEAANLEYSKEELVNLAKIISENLKQLKRWKDAGNILELYTEDHESSILAYLNGNLWQDALRLIYCNNRQDIIETNLKPSLIESFAHQTETISKLKENFTRYKERLIIVRSMKEKQAFEIAEGIRDEAGNDLFSETSSITGQSGVSSTSKASRSSGHSSKSRRKYQRKKYSLKEGSKFEDFALLEALAEIVNSADVLQDELGTLLEMLFLFSFEIEAASLQNAFEDLLLLIKRNKAEIWKFASAGNMFRTEIGPQSTVNSILENMQRKTETEQCNDLPEPTRPFLRENVSWKLHHLL